MQRLTALALSACLLLALAGCGGGEDAAPGWTAMGAGPRDGLGRYPRRLRAGHGGIFRDCRRGATA